MRLFGAGIPAALTAATMSGALCAYLLAAAPRRFCSDSVLTNLHSGDSHTRLAKIQRGQPMSHVVGSIHAEEREPSWKEEDDDILGPNYVGRIDDQLKMDPRHLRSTANSRVATSPGNDSRAFSRSTRDLRSRSSKQSLRGTQSLANLRVNPSKPPKARLSRGTRATRQARDSDFEGVTKGGRSPLAGGMAGLSVSFNPGKIDTRRHSGSGRSV